MTNIIYLFLLLCVAHHVLASEDGSVLSKRKYLTESEGTLDVEDDEVSSSVDTESEYEGEISSNDIASHRNTKEFMKAVSKYNLVRASEVFHDAYEGTGGFKEFETDEGADAFQKYCGEHLINLGQAKLVTFLNIARAIDKHEDDDDPNRDGDFKSLQAWILRTILTYANREFVDAVLDEFKPSDGVLSKTAHHLPLSCKPDGFINLLKRITPTNVKSLREAIANGIWELHRPPSFECFIPLISAFRKEPVVGPGWANIAIRYVFGEADITPPADGGLLIKAYFNDPAIDEERYFAILFYSYTKSVDSEKTYFRWLLERATVYDVARARKNPEFSGMPYPFKGALDIALIVTGYESRTQKDLRIRYRMARYVWDELRGIFSPAIIKIIFDCRPDW